MYYDYTRAITSQNGTAPKRDSGHTTRGSRAITSQNGTAPKHVSGLVVADIGAITSQNGTAPKRVSPFLGRDCVRLPVRTALLQNHPVQVHEAE